MSNQDPFKFRGCTVNLTNGESLTILQRWAVKGFSVINLASSTDNATINGGTDLPGAPTENTVIIPGASRAWSAPNNGYLVGMVITAGASCTVQVQILI